MVTVDKHYRIRRTHYAPKFSTPALFVRRRVTHKPPERIPLGAGNSWSPAGRQISQWNAPLATIWCKNKFTTTGCHWLKNASKINKLGPEHREVCWEGSWACEVNEANGLKRRPGGPARIGAAACEHAPYGKPRLAVGPGWTGGLASCPPVRSARPASPYRY